MKRVEKLELGNRYSDRITQIEGVCTGVAEYLTGCTQALLEYVNTTGTRIAEWMDIDRLDQVDAEKIMHQVSRAGAGPLPPGSRAPSS